jgi:hypothetical protein
MATTTNYGWTTPDDTALVKDGAAAIRTLGTSVDTTTKNLNPSTTLGDIEYRSSTANTNTRVGIGSSGQALTVVAGVPSWAASATSVLTTTGDILYASAANTLARRAIGSTGDVLTVSGGLPTWATPASGGMTLLSTTTLSGTSTTISSIPHTYNSLFIVVSGLTYTTSNGKFRCLPNSSTTEAAYSGVAAATAKSTSATSINLDFDQDIDRTVATNAWAITFNNYASTTAIKPFTFYGRFLQAGPADRPVEAAGAFCSNTAITSLVFDCQGTRTMSTGTVLLYGVK